MISFNNYMVVVSLDEVALHYFIFGGFFLGGANEIDIYIHICENGVCFDWKGSKGQLKWI